MNRAPPRYIILRTCGMLAAGAAGAGPRNSGASTAKPAAGQQQMQAWLARLKGSFTVKLSEAEQL